MKLRHLSLALALLFGISAGAQQTINDGWTFEGKPVNIPHTWNADSYTLKDYRKGTFTYERRFTLGKSDQRKYIRFDGVFKVADVWLNGQYVGHHQGGYTAFSFDITPFVREGENLLKVVVSNQNESVPPISADFTFMGGIYRDVWLIEKGAQHFDTAGLWATADTTSVRVSGRIKHLLPTPRACMVTTTLTDADGRQLATARQRIKLSRDTTVSLTMPTPKDAHLWTPEKPYLYRVTTTLTTADGRQLLDTEEHSVAIRWYAFDAARGFMLNGQPYKLHGVCIHQDQPPFGIALDDDQHRRDFRMMKQMGVNFVRLAHYPQDDALLEMCDREGMLVWEEIPVVDYVPDDAAFAENCQQQLREMIRQHRSHPCVILWGYMNEILLTTWRHYQGTALDSAKQRTLQLATALERIVHEEDATRTSVMACHGSNEYNTVGMTEIPQVIGWNLYQGWYGADMSDFERYLEQQHQSQPTHPIIVSEYGAGSDLRLHNPTSSKAFDFSADYQQRYVEHYLPVIEQTPYVCGGAYWNFIDFASANRDESMPRINNKGLVTAQRAPKDVYYYFQAMWRKDIPVVHIATTDWPQREVSEATMPVKVYTNQTEVELLLNGRSLGTQQVSNCTACFEVTLDEGKNTLLAKAGNSEDAQQVDCRLVQPTQLSINVGSDCYYQSAASATTWQPDRAYTPGGYGYIGGKPVQTQAEIHLTADNPLYQTQRHGMDEYRFDVAAGTYELELLTADIHQQQPSSAYLLGREDEAAESNGRMQVSVNGQPLETGFQPQQPFQAIRRRYIIHNRQDHISIRFSPEAYLSAIQLRHINP